MESFIEISKSPKVTPVKSSVLRVVSHAGMPAPLIGGITTKKEFQAILEAIAFIKAINYPMTPHIIKELSEISDRTYRNRTKLLIKALIKMQQYADDVYSEKRGREVYGDVGAECLIDKDGIIVSKDVEEITIFKMIIQEKISIMALYGSTYIDSTNVLTESDIIGILLSEDFLLKIGHGIFGLHEPLRAYLIEPMKKKYIEMIGYPKWEKLMLRLFNSIFFGIGSDKSIMFDPIRDQFVDMIGSLSGYLLKSHKVESGHKLKKIKTIETLGKHLINVYIKSVSGRGNIHSRNISLHYLHHRTTTTLPTKLFTKGKSWKAGGYSISYKPTNKMEEIVNEAFAAFMRLPVKEVNENAEKAFIRNPNIEFFHKDTLSKIHIKDRVFLMSRVVGFRSGKYYFKIDAIDRQASRVYSSITSIQSIARDAMGFYNYDMSVAQTAICLQLVHNTSKYPRHQQMVKNKLLFRENISSITGWDYKKVKKELSALDNGQSINGYTNTIKRALLPFFEESRALMEDVIETVKTNDPVVYQQASMLSKDSMKNGEIIGKKQSSIYFFIWTQYERQIREAMKSCFREPVYDVHDAVYSREKVDFELMELVVLEQTGFDVKIEG